MNKTERNIKTANAIFLNVIRRLGNGEDVNINDYFTSSAVRDILGDWFIDDVAIRIGLKEKAKPIREVPADLEKRLRKRVVAREEERYRAIA